MVDKVRRVRGLGQNSKTGLLTNKESNVHYARLSKQKLPLRYYLRFSHIRIENSSQNVVGNRNSAVVYRFGGRGDVVFNHSP